MRKDIQDKYLSLFKKGESLTQKEVAARLGVTVASASKNLRYLYEINLLKTSVQPGMSMRYSLRNNFEVIRSVSGDPLYIMYDDSLSQSDPGEYLGQFNKTLVTQFLNGTLSKTELSTAYAPIIAKVGTLIEILINASPGQVKATNQALIESQGSEPNVPQMP